MKTILILAAAALLIPSAAGASGQPVTEPYAALPVEITPHKVVPNPDNKASDPNKLICQSEEQIGSRLGGHKTCMTAEQWTEKHREQREFTDAMQAGAEARDSAVQPPAALQGLGPQ
jgi:hypothetical protein